MLPMLSPIFLAFLNLTAKENVRSELKRAHGSCFPSWTKVFNFDLKPVQYSVVLAVVKIKFKLDV